MTVFRTPDEAFANLPDYRFAPHYADVAGLRMHYVDEGPRAAAPILLLHGNPSWSYLYRHMIPALTAAGHRVIAPDLIGFGKSDKPTDRSDYTYAGHVAWMTQFLEQLDLTNITLFCQDWGSLIGLRVAAEQEHRFARIVVGNGALPVADPEARPKPTALLAFAAWRAFATYAPVLPVGRIIARGTVRKLTRSERRAYDAPYPTRASKAGARALPGLVPLSDRDPAIPANRAAWEILGRWEKPFLTVFGEKDPILGGFDRVLHDHIPGTAGMPHARLRAGHFLQEDVGPELARRIDELIAATPNAVSSPHTTPLQTLG